MTALRVRALALLIPLLLPGALRGQDAVVLPCAGDRERLDYRVSVGRMGNVGRGTMWIDGTAEIRGRQTMVLRFELQAGKGPIKAHDRTASWLDPRRMTAMRFEKAEKHPLSKHEETVELYPDAHRWVDAQGVLGDIGTDAPLDELSFLYFLRTIPFGSDTAWRFDRHFEASRNPTTVRLVGRRTLVTPAGEFRTLQVEMRVRDPRRYRGEGVIRIDLSDDPRRLPVRVESRMPVLGQTVLTLESVSGTSAVAALAAKPAGSC